MNTSAALWDSIETLVDRALRGDQQAMLSIVNRYRQRVFGLCYRMLGHHQDAEDVTQEAFLRVLRNLASWDQKRAFEPWLLTIAANRCRTQIARRASKSPHQSLGFTPSDDRWREDTRAQHLQEELQLASAELPTTHRQAFDLFHHRQLTYAEIARELDVPEGTAKTWVHRARRELARRLLARQAVEGNRHAM